MKKLLILSIAAVALMSCQEKKMDRFEREAREYTAKHCPERIDDVTTLDSIVFHNTGNGNLSLYYSLSLDDEMKAKLQEVKDNISDENLRLIRNTMTFIPYKEAGVDFTYIYSDKGSGTEQVRMHYTKDDYK